MSVGFVALEDVSEHMGLSDLEEAIDFAPQMWVERQSNLLEVATYTIIKNHDGQVFGYWRDGGEERLHDNYSIGVGGHIEEQDISGTRNVAVSAAMRENAEEVGVVAQTPTYVRVIYSEADAVSRDHLGVVFEMEVESLEGGDIDGGFVDVEQLSDLETWSQIIVDEVLA